MQLRKRLQRLLLCATLMGLGVQFLPAITAGAELEKTTSQNQQEQKIEIVADRLISNNQEKYAEFQGDVVATQADFKVTSDTLRIYYEGELVKTENKSSSEETIKKIVATGTVKITTEQYQAEADKVEYDVPTQILVLTGENSTVISGNNSIQGAKITLWRADGRVKVDGSPKSRVKAVLYSKGEDTNPFDMKEPDKGKKKPQQ